MTMNNNTSIRIEIEPTLKTKIQQINQKKKKNTKQTKIHIP